MPTLTPPARSRWQIVSGAPHRLLFLAGSGQLLTVMAWWAATLAARLGDLSLPAPVLPGSALHGFLMLYGVFPFFIFGFLFTVYPRWRGQPPIARTTCLITFAGLGTGMLLIWLGLFAQRAVLVAGLALYLAGFVQAVRVLYRVAGRDGWRDPHLRTLNLALAAGAAGIAFFAIYSLGESPLVLTVARETGLWLFLVPVVFAVSHRMIPVFSQGVLMNYLIVRPVWGLPLMVVCVIAHAMLELAGFPHWRFLADAPLAVAALHHSWRWQLRRSFHARLLAMLHLAFLWFGIAMALYTLQSLALLATGTDHFGRAPLHALGVGFIAGMVVAMGSRVILGHSGQALHADTLTWLALLGLQLGAITRVIAEFAPAASAALNLAAALLWLAFLVPWVVRYAPLLWRARLDGQPG